MAESERQKRITGRVMHEFKHRELKSGRDGKAGGVNNRRQADVGSQLGPIDKRMQMTLRLT
jgi:hypothetical protein